MQRNFRWAQTKGCSKFVTYYTRFIEFIILGRIGWSIEVIADIPITIRELKLSNQKNENKLQFYILDCLSMKALRFVAMACGSRGLGQALKA